MTIRELFPEKVLREHLAEQEPEWPLWETPCQEAIKYARQGRKDRLVRLFDGTEVPAEWIINAFSLAEFVAPEAPDPLMEPLVDPFAGG